MKTALVALALAAGAAGLPFDLHPPAWIERWLYNPRERTEQAIDAYEEGQTAEAVELAETALRLGGGDADPPERHARLAYNAGTAQLAAGEPDRARARLEEAVATMEEQAAAVDALAPRAHYNLGNARLAADDAAGAVESFKQALRLDPDDEDAKFNLELALRALEKQRQGGSTPQESPEGESSGDQESSDEPGPDQPPDPNREQEPSDDGQATPPADRPEEREGRDQPPQPEPRLPDFENQPDMSAAEAAAILEAVENLERQQRRAQALERSRRRAAGGKDW